MPNPRAATERDRFIRPEDPSEPGRASVTLAPPAALSAGRLLDLLVLQLQRLTGSSSSLNRGRG